MQFLTIFVIVAIEMKFAKYSNILLSIWLLIVTSYSKSNANIINLYEKLHFYELAYERVMQFYNLFKKFQPLN